MGGQDQNAAECGEGNHRKGKLSPECTANLVAVRLAGILAGIGAVTVQTLGLPELS